MRKTLWVKRVSLITLSILLACTMLLIGFINRKPYKALADQGTETVNVTDFISVSSHATVTPAQKVGAPANDAFFQYGLLITSDKAYSGDIVPTFNGNASIVFRFMHPTSTSFGTGTSSGGDKNGDFKFILTDLIDPSNYLAVHYLEGQTVRTEYSTADGVKYLSATAFQPGFNNVSFNFNLLDFAWSGDNGDELVISTTTGKWSSASVVARFDGSTEDLPKIAFPNGYKISFVSDYAEGTDIAFKSILGASIMGESGEAYKKNDDMTLSEETVAVPATATEVITYNGIEVVDGGTVSIPQYKTLGTFSTAWKYGNMLFPKTALTAIGSIDTSTVGNTANISVEKDGTHTYTFKVIEPVAPALNLSGAKPENGFVKRAVELPIPSSDIGITVQIAVTVDKTNVPVNEFSFMPTQAGIHTVTYTAEGYGFTVTESFDIDIIVDTVKPIITIDYEDIYVPVGTEVELPTATATDNADGEKEVTLRVTYNGEPVSVVSHKFNATTVGEYKVSYSCEDISGNKEEIIYTVYCVSLSDYASVTVDKLVTLENATVTAQKVSNKYSGLGISSTTAYDGSFNAVFEGDKSLIFKFTGASGDNSGRGNGKGDFFFKVADANNPDDYFTVEYGGSATLGVYVTYKGEKRYCDAAGTPKAGSLNATNEWTTHAWMLGFSSDSSNHYNKLALTWEDGVLSVIVNQERWLPAMDCAIAKFDGTDAVSAKTWGLPKLNWSSYTISFGSDYEEGTTDKGSDIVFLGLNGETDGFATAEVSGAIVDTFLHNGKIVEANDTLYTIKSEGFGEFYSRFVVNGTMFRCEKLTANETIPTDYGYHTVSFTVAGKTYPFTLRVADEFNAPVIKLADEISSLTVAVQNSQINVSATDVVATDDSCGVMQAEKIKIYVKKATDSDFVVYTTEYAFANLGEYIIRYVVSDVSANESYIERTIKVISSVGPTITLSGEIGKTQYVGQTITLPTATATGTTVALIVSFNGEVLETVDNKIAFDEAGMYAIVYKATSAEGVVSVKEFIITAIKDTEAPVMTVDFADKTVKLGSVITLSTATAADNVDGTVVVSVSVKFGTEDVQISDGGFTADKLGAYSITYFCKDSSGNFSEELFTITVEENGEQTNDSSNNAGNNGASDSANQNGGGGTNGCAGGCTGSIDAGVVGIMALACIVLPIVRKRKSKE